MPKPRRDPYVAMDATIRSNAKLAALPSDTARLGWLYVGLGSAKLQRPSGCFRSRAHWNEVAGRFAKHLAQYLSQGLIEEAPRLCERCEAVWPRLPDGSLVVHDWKRHQTDPGAGPQIEFQDPSAPMPGFERTRWWRLRTAVFERDEFRCRYCGNDAYDRKHLVVDHVIPVDEGRIDTMDNLVTACRSCNGRKGGRRPEQAGMVLLPVPNETANETQGDKRSDVTSAPNETAGASRNGTAGDVTSRAPAGPRAARGEGESERGLTRPSSSRGARANGLVDPSGEPEEAVPWV